MKLTENRDGVYDGDFRSKGVEMPIALNYQTTLAPGQSSRPSNQIHFKNPYRSPMWVDEFHFNIVANASTSLPPSVFGMRLKCNAQFVSDEFVPLVLLGPHTDWAETGIYQTPFVNYSKVTFYSFIWKLAKPMWVDELDDLTMELNWLTNEKALHAVATSANVTVTICGRATRSENRPKQRALPFNVVWTPELFETLASAESYKISPDSALRNGRNTPATITRIMGDMRLSPTSTTSAVFLPTSNMLLDVKLSHSLGYFLTSSFIPYYELFNNLSRELAVKFVLQPKEFLTVELQTRVFTAVGYPQTLQPFTYYGGFALQGYTLEPLS